MSDASHAPVSIHFLRNVTLEAIADPLRAAGEARHLGVEARFGGYGDYVQEAIDPASKLRASPPDVAVLFLWLDALPLAWGADGSLQPEAVLSHVRTAVSHITAGTTATLLVSTFLAPIRAVQGAGFADALARLNQGVRELAASMPRVEVTDLETIARRVGDDGTYDRRFYFLYRSPLKPAFLRAWASALAARLAARSGAARKVLVVDCDNTLWGGVLGEDGLTGIKLDPESYPGNAFTVFQQQLVALASSGVLLALASKNNEGDVLEVLDRHPHTVLRRSHFAAWRINWETKTENLRALARELNLSLESFVFVDDSKTECAHVREALPMVDVLEVPEAAHELPLLLSRYEGFSLAPPTAEDRDRARYYQAERARAEVATQFASVDQFLASLDLVADVGPPRADEIARVAQLTQRTNQFNLTTRRYGEGEIHGLARDSVVVVLGAADRFGDHGLTGVAIAVRAGSEARIDTLLLSCRILGRRFEDVLLAELRRAVTARFGDVKLRAEYRRTSKNEQVRDFYDRHGFEVVEESPDAVRYVATRAPDAPPPFIQIMRREEAT